MASCSSLGLGTRLIAIPFVIEMLVAMLSTKPALFLGTSPLPLPPAPPQIGMWAVLHEVRSEFAQLMSCLFLLIAGPGPWSLDALLDGWIAPERARRVGGGEERRRPRPPSVQRRDAGWVATYNGRDVEPSAPHARLMSRRLG